MLYQRKEYLPFGLAVINMKRSAFLTVILVLAVSLCLVFSVSAEETSAAPVDTVTFKRLTVPVDAETIDLGRNIVERYEYQAFYDFLHQLPNLKHVDMFSTHITAPYIHELTSQFPQVTFGWTMEFSRHKHLVRTDAVVFSTLHYDQDRRHTEEDFALLKYCPDLLALDIGHNELHDLSFLYDLPKLRVLILSDDRIACDITPIGSLQDLIFLEMYKNKITDITPLTSLTKLRHLNLNFNLIEDLTPLKSMQQLEHLWIAYSTSFSLSMPVDPAIAADIAASMPNTVVNSVVRTCDGGGWLDFVDEKRVKRMFNQRKYIPLQCEEEASSD